MRHIGPMPGIGNLITQNPVLWYDRTLSAPGRFDVTGIPAGYSHIEGLALLKSSVATDSDNCDIFLNNDTTLANYYRQRHVSGTSAHSVNAGDNPTLDGALNGANVSAGFFVLVQFSISWYSITTHEKLIFVRIQRREVAASQYNLMYTVSRENTEAVNQITIQPDGYATDTFVADSRLQIWLYR